jgi:hypothetical protein
MDDLLRKDVAVNPENIIEVLDTGLLNGDGYQTFSFLPSHW